MLFKNIKEVKFILKSNFKRKLASVLVAGIITITTLGTGVAAAASGSANVGGGAWSWSTIPNFRASSVYYHPSRLHTASSQVGGGKMKVAWGGPGQTAKSTSYGIGATNVYWNVY